MKKTDSYMLPFNATNTIPYAKNFLHGAMQIFNEQKNKRVYQNFILIHPLSK